MAEVLNAFKSFGVYLRESVRLALPILTRPSGNLDGEASLAPLPFVTSPGAALGDHASFTITVLASGMRRAKPTLRR
jgi:hypothetical protein